MAFPPCRAASAVIMKKSSTLLATAATGGVLPTLTST